MAKPIIDVKDLVVSSPDITKLTTGKLTGNGVFDKLMAAVKEHLAVEYNQQRITGKDYATVYLGAITGVMQFGVQYVLNEAQAVKVMAETGLTRQKTVTELAATDDTLPLGLGYNATMEIKGLLGQQVENAKNEAELNEQRIVTELAKTSDKLKAGLGHNSSTELQGAMGAEIQKIDAEMDFTVQRTITELTNTSNYIPEGKGWNSSTSVGGSVHANIDKMEKEKDLLVQKTVTEIANTADTIPYGLGQGHSQNSDVLGMVGKQKALYHAQAEGFYRDAEQQVAKIYSDLVAIRYTSDPDTKYSEAGFSDSATVDTLNVLREGVGMKPFNP